MSNTLTDLLANLQATPLPPGASEEAAKFGIIGPVLHRLGWDPSDHQTVIPEYRVGSLRVDFLLRTETTRVFVEAKKPSEALDSQQHQQQLLQYAFQEGVDIAVLTNGTTWWFYLPGATGRSWDQRKFFAIDVMQQEPATAAAHFERFLGRAKVSSGSAMEAAAEVLDHANRSEAIMRTLPLSWERLATEPDELLVDLISDAVEGQCGYRPDAETVAEFLLKVRLPGGAVLRAPIEVARRVGPTPFERTPMTDGYTGRTPPAFTILGTRHGVRTWKEVLIGVAWTLFQRHRTEFERVLALRGRKRSYFSMDSQVLLAPAPIGDSGYFAETNLDANHIVKRCRDLLLLFGYENPDSYLTIETT